MLSREGWVAAIFLVLICGVGDAVPAGRNTAALQPCAHVRQYKNEPSVFVLNAGQWPDTVKFALDGTGANVGITDHGPCFQLFYPPETSEVRDDADSMHEFSVTFEGAAPVSPAGHGRSDRKFNYHLGDEATRYRNGVPSFNAVRYHNLYPGITLELGGTRAGLKYAFHVAPGANPALIRIRYEGIESLAPASDGALEIRIAPGWPVLTDGAPFLYQDGNGKRQEVPGRFVLFDDHSCGFEVTGAYDPALPLIIDPEVAWGTYLGGSDADYGQAIAMDSSGNGYLAGSTNSSGWVSGGFDASQNGSSDVFVAKLDASGAHLWSTYLGGANADYGYAIALDSAANCYVTGYTYSPAWASGGFDTTLNNGGSGYDGYVAKLDAAGGHLWSTYLGGTDADYGWGIAVDSGGNCYAVGYTNSPGWVSGGLDTILNNGGSGNDGYLVKLDTNGAHQWSTYLGGAGNELTAGVATDSSGNCYVTGNTNSSGWMSGGFDTTQNGVVDGYVIKFNTSGAHQWSTYLGGPDSDYGWGIALDVDRNCYVTGYTNSSGWASGGFDTSFNGSYDGFVLKLNSSGAHLWSTYVGGANMDRGWGVALDSMGNCFFSGYTNSPAWVSGGFDLTLNEGGTGYDGYIVKLDAAGLHRWSSFLGSAGSDQAYGIAMDPSGNGYVTGQTASSDWLSAGFDTTYNGNVDAFVVRILGLPAAPSTPGSTGVGTNTITWTWADNASNETGFKVYDDPGAAEPTTLWITTPADTLSWQHSGLAANTQYAFQVAATSIDGDSALTDNYTTWTLIEACAGLTFSDISADAIQVVSENVPSNLTSGGSGLCFENVTAGTNSGWRQNNSDWISGGLLPNTPYVFTGCSRNGAGVTTAPTSAEQWTMAAQPLAPDVTNVAYHTLEVSLNAGDGNPPGTEYAIQVASGLDSDIWVQADGSMGAIPVYQTVAAWDTVTVTGLDTGTFYAVVAVARNGAGVDAEPGLANYAQTLEDSPPTGTVLINNGDSFTNQTAVTLSLFAEDTGSGVSEMRFSENNVDWGAWETYATSKAWNLGAADGVKAVYVQFRDGVGNLSDVATDTITLDTTLPTGTITINAGAIYTNARAVLLSLSAADAGAGLSHMCFSNDGLTWDDWQTYDITRTWTLASGDEEKSAYVRYRDGAGNVSQTVTDTITLDTIAPAGSISVNEDAAHTDTRAVTLTLSAADSGSGISQMRLSNVGASWSAWESYNASRPWTLSSGDAVKSVRAQFRDNAGNLSDIVTDSITLDTAGPVFLNIEADPVQASEDDIVRITFDVSEALEDEPHVTVNGHEAMRETAAPGWVYRYTVLGPEEDPLGPAYLEIAGVDLFGHDGAAGTSDVLTIVEVAQVPATGFLALLALASALSGAVLRRRR